MIRAVVCSFFKMGQLSMLIYQYSVVVMLRWPASFLFAFGKYAIQRGACVWCSDKFKFKQKSNTKYDSLTPMTAHTHKGHFKSICLC